jgi:hypothetical protein
MQTIDAQAMLNHRIVLFVPRWFSRLTLLGAAGPAFFHLGPFTEHGLLAFYPPMVIWGLYLILTARYMYQALNREQASHELG